VTSNGDEQLLEGNLSWISDIIEIDVVDEIFSSTETQTTSSSISLVLFSFFYSSFINISSSEKTILNQKDRRLKWFNWVRCVSSLYY